MPYLSIIVVYSIAQIALGVWVARRMKGSSDFFVAGRALGPGLLFATFLAANIGSGSTIGATGLGYRDGIAAVWWVGSAGLGSLVLALSVGPRIRRLAAEHDLRTVGDFLEWRYDRRVRATIAALLWIGTVCILAGQLMGIAWILTVVVGTPKIVGCALGALVITAYFAAGGLKSSAVVNVVQLTVKLAGFAIALPIVLALAGGVDGLHAALPDPGMWNPWRNGPSGWIYIAMLGAELHRLAGTPAEGLRRARRSRRPRRRRSQCRSSCSSTRSCRCCSGCLRACCIRDWRARIARWRCRCCSCTICRSGWARSAWPRFSPPKSARLTRSCSCWRRRCRRISTSAS